MVLLLHTGRYHEAKCYAILFLPSSDDGRKETETREDHSQPVTGGRGRWGAPQNVNFHLLSSNSFSLLLFNLFLIAKTLWAIYCYRV